MIRFPSTKTWYINDGWIPIVQKLIEDINRLSGDLDVNVVEIKEKFGTLRFYVDGSSKEIDELIDEAELKSSITCDLCGQPGELRRGGWLRTLCDECHNKDVKRK